MLQARDIWKIVIIYALFGSAWIVFSDQLLLLYFDGTDDVLSLSIIKGLLFIIATSALLYILIARQRTRINASIQALRDSEERCFRYRLRDG